VYLPTVVEIIPVCRSSIWIPGGVAPPLPRKMLRGRRWRGGERRLYTVQGERVSRREKCVGRAADDADIAPGPPMHVRRGPDR